MQRDVAQLGSAPLWGSGGLGFKSQHSDFVIKKAEILSCNISAFFIYLLHLLNHLELVLYAGFLFLPMTAILP